MQISITLLGFEPSSAGLVPALNASGLVDVTVSGDDSPYIEYFGGGTAITDNTAAILAAISQGFPVKFGPGTYYVKTGLVVSSNAVFIGIRGATTVTRQSSGGSGTWIDFTCSTVYLDGIAFDHNTAFVTAALGVVIGATVTTSVVTNCQFLNNKSPLNPFSGSQPYSTQGCGLLYQTTTPSSTVISHAISGCLFAFNNSDGLQILNVNDVLISECISHSNESDGIAVYGDIANEAPNNRVIINGCLTYANNGDGIFLDYVYNGTLQEYSDKFPSTIGAQIVSNRSHNNGAYGIYIGTIKNALIQGNLCHDNSTINSNAAEILGDCSYFTEFSDNILYGTSSFGIDAAGGYYCSFNNNVISGSTGAALNIGGSTGNSASGNRIANFMGLA